MKCPLVINPAGVLGTVQYMAPCECIKLCDYCQCQYMCNGFLIQIGAAGATATDTVNILASCGGSLPLVAQSTGDLVTVADLAVNTIYRVYPVKIGGILRGVVQEL